MTLSIWQPPQQPDAPASSARLYRNTGKSRYHPQVIDNPHGCSSIDIGCALSRELFANGCSATAIFASTDSMALGVLQAADEYGISVPDDISLLGFDNIIYSALPKIELSTVDQRKQLLAEATVDLLTRIIDSDEQDEFTHRMIRPTLVSRSSCRASKNKSTALRTDRLSLLTLLSHTIHQQVNRSAAD